MDLQRTFNIVYKYVVANLSPATAMAKIIADCEAMRPHHDWSKFRELPYDDMSDLEEWISRVLNTEPPNPSINGLWFGLFNPIYDGQPVADIYICGSTRFDADPDESEWAVGPEWWPEHRYAHSTILAAIYRTAYTANGLANDAEYPLCLAYGALATKQLLNVYGRDLILPATKSVGVATGFDSGDFILLGKLTDVGLQTLVPDD